MALHHEHLCYQTPSLIAAASIYVALKICEQMKQKPYLTKDLLQKILDKAGVEEQQLIKLAKKILYLA